MLWCCYIDEHRHILAYVVTYVGTEFPEFLILGILSYRLLCRICPDFGTFRNGITGIRRNAGIPGFLLLLHSKTQPFAEVFPLTRISLFTCSIPPCSWVVGVFKKPLFCFLFSDKVAINAAYDHNNHGLPSAALRLGRWWLPIICLSWLCIYNPSDLLIWSSGTTLGSGTPDTSCYFLYLGY